jgi:hypothetical protein
MSKMATEVARDKLQGQVNIWGPEETDKRTKESKELNYGNGPAHDDSRCIARGGKPIYQIYKSTDSKQGKTPPMRRIQRSSIQTPTNLLLDALMLHGRALCPSFLRSIPAS